MTISHRHGIDTHLAASEADAHATVHGYVAEWWAQVIPDIPMPEDPEAAVAAYFEQVEDEWAEITTVEAPRPGA